MRIFKTATKILDESFSICSFGSNSDQEKDIATFGGNLPIEQQLNQIDELLLAYSKEYVIVTKREHQSFIKESRPFLHFLYYPTSDIFQYNELQSFAHYLYIHGNFINYKPVFLKYLSDNYIENSETLLRPDAVQFGRYCEMALHCYIYSVSNSPWWTFNSYRKAFSYLNKYISLERARLEFKFEEVPFNSFSDFAIINEEPKSKQDLLNNFRQLVIISLNYFFK